MRTFRAPWLSQVLIGAFACCAVDKQLHMAASYGIQMTASHTYRRMNYRYPELMALGTTMAVGILKEVTDPRFSGGDVAADAVGAGAAAAFNWTWEW